MAFRVNYSVSPKPIEFDFKSVQPVPVSDHSKLKNRDEADQHPIGAITGLEDALQQSQESVEAAQKTATTAQETAEAAKKAAEEAKTAAGNAISAHDQLSGRDAPDQHPIEAITGLSGTIDSLQDSDAALEETTEVLKETTEVLKKSIEEVEPDALSNTEIDDLWKSIM